MAQRSKSEVTNEVEVEKADQDKSANTSGHALPNYLKAALRLPTTRPLGADRVDTDLVTIDGKAYVNDFPVAGVCVLDYVPTLGYSKDATSAVNRASFDNFNILRAQISGNRPYEPADHMIYRAGVDSMRDLYMYVARIYKIINTYSASSLYKPRAILAAMGLDPSSWINNASALYQWLLSHAGSLLPFPTVDIGNITERHHIYNSYLFSDGEAASSQTYIMNQKAFWSYEVVDEVRGLTLRQMPASFESFIDMWDEMYVALQGSSDVYIIAADIRRAFGDAVITNLVAPSAGDQAEYIKLDPMLCSIMNAAVVGTDFYAGQMSLVKRMEAFRIYDEAGIIKCDPEWSGPVNSFDLNNNVPFTRIPVFTNHVNLVNDQPTEEDLLNAVRLKPAFHTYITNSTDNDATLHVEFESFGTEVVVDARVCTLPSAIDASNYDIVANYPFSSGMVSLSYSGSQSEPASVVAMMRTLGGLSVCDWAPPVTMLRMSWDDAEGHVRLSANTSWNGVSDRDATKITETIEDVQNYVPITIENIKQIHDNNLLAEFGFQE